MTASASRRPWRSIGTVLLGILLIFALSLGIDGVLHATGIFPPIGQPMSDAKFLIATAYRVLIGIAGSYLTGRLAPNRPMTHAMTLGGIGLILSTLGAAATWNAGPAFGPHWYPLTLVLTALPCAWLGGKLAQQSSPPQGNS